MKSKNIFWQNTTITRSDREKLNKHKGVCIWFTGLSGSGKTTIANGLEVELYKLGVHTYLIDGDNIRHGLSSDLGFSSEDIYENNRRIAEVTKLFVDAGICVINTIISPFKENRENVRKLLPKDAFIEIFVDADLKTREARDPKGLYEKVRRGEIKNFIGTNNEYEIPENADVVINTTENDNIDQNIQKVLAFLKKQQFLSKLIEQ